MGARSKLIGQIVSALTTAAFPLFDFWGVKIGDKPIPWQILAVASFVIFVTLVAWQESELLRRLHPERLIRVTAFGEPGTGTPYSWRGIDSPRQRADAPRLCIGADHGSEPW